MSTLEIILPGESLHLDPESSGFAHGFGLFETMRLRGACLELWAAHWQRLRQSAHKLGIVCPFDEAEVLLAVRELAKDVTGEAALKLSLLRNDHDSRLLIYSRPVTALPEVFGLLLDNPAPFNQASPLAGHKTHNYLENLLVLEVARELGCFDGLRLNLQGDVVEGAISNIFFFRDGGWHTPGLASGALPGVTRAALTQCLPVQEGSYPLEMVLSAEAVFLTNASMGLQAVDFLQRNGKKTPLQSRQHSCFQPARQRLAEYIADHSIQI